MSYQKSFPSLTTVGRVLCDVFSFSSLCTYIIMRLCLLLSPQDDGTFIPHHGKAMKMMSIAGTFSRFINSAETSN